LKKLITINNSNNYNLQNTSSLTVDDFAKEDIIIKNELEPLDSNIKLVYEILIKYAGEDCIRKIFSKQIAWKEEGWEMLNNTLSKIITESKKKNEIQVVINQLLKIINNFLNDRLPQICIRSMDSLLNMLTEIKHSKISVQYDQSLTDFILLKIKEKLGNVKIKMRRKAVELYCHMLNLDFCDYNNLLYELVEDELKQLDTKRLNRSSKIIFGKLQIYDNVFENLETAIKMKRTDINQFPFIQIATYVIENIGHSKSEIRKLVRTIVIKVCRYFGFKKLEPLLKKVDNRELEKLVTDIPEVSDIIKQNNLKHNQVIANKIVKNERTRSPGRSSSGGKNPKPKKEKQSKDIDKSFSSLAGDTTSLCVHCGKSDLKNGIDEHVETECVLFINCFKCGFNVMVNNYNNHLLYECEFKKDFKICKRCKEAIGFKDYDRHVRDNKCNPAKNINSSNRCPLCHKDIPPFDKGFFQHLVKDICQNHKRRDKITFVNGK